MSRPPGPEIDALVDASVQAHARGTVQRRFEASQLPRLSEAGIIEPGEIGLAIRFSIVAEHVALDGELSGFVTMICQRCMQPVKVEVADDFQLIIVDDEAEGMEQAETSAGYEPIVADPARLDLRWLAEEQTLLSVPLVAKHTDEQCASGLKPSPTSKEEIAGQRPFANLKNMLRGK